MRSRKKNLTQRKSQEKKQIQKANKRIQDAIQVKQLFKAQDRVTLNINFKFDLP